MDGCTENVVQAVKAELPQARVFVNQIGLGSVASRDRMMREARGDFVLALDDDSYPEQLDCMSRIVPFLNSGPNWRCSISLSALMNIPKHSRKQTLGPNIRRDRLLTRARPCVDPRISTGRF